MSARTSAVGANDRPPAIKFSSTLRSGNVPRPWGTWATPRRTMSAVRCPASSSPASRTEPSVDTMAHSARSVVVLPAPLAPKITAICPSATEKSMPCSTWMSP